MKKNLTSWNIYLNSILTLPINSLDSKIVLYTRWRIVKANETDKSYL